MHFVYLLESESFHTWYIGYTTDIQNRVMAHNLGKNVSTVYRRPWKLLYYEAYLEKADALGREKFLKSGSGHRFLRKQLAQYFSAHIFNPPQIPILESGAKC